MAFFTVPSFFNPLPVAGHLLTVDIKQHRALDSTPVTFGLGNPDRNLLRYSEIGASI